VGRVFFDAFHSQDGSRVVLNFVRGSALYEPGPNRIRWFSRGDYPWLFREHDKPEEFSTWNDVAFFPDGDRLLIASKMSPAKVIDRNGRILCTLACRGRGGDWATKVAVSPRGRWILTSSLKGPVRIWRVRDRNLVALAAVLPTLGLDQLNALGFIPGGGGFYTAGAGTSEEDPQRSQGFVRTRNLSGEKTWEELLTDPVIRFTYSRDGRFFLAGTTRFCRVWSAPDRRTLYDMPFAGLGRLGKISIARNSIQFSPSGAWIMAKLRNETMRKALLYWPTRVEDLIGWGRQKLGDRRE